MAETKTIGKISIVTDSENSYDQIGDVDGGFDERELKKYIANHGHERLCEKLTVMQWQIWKLVREVNWEDNKDEITVSNNID